MEILDSTFPTAGQISINSISISIRWGVGAINNPRTGCAETTRRPSKAADLPTTTLTFWDRLGEERIARLVCSLRAVVE